MYCFTLHTTSEQSSRGISGGQLHCQEAKQIGMNGCLGGMRMSSQSIQLLCLPIPTSFHCSAQKTQEHRWAAQRVPNWEHRHLPPGLPTPTPSVKSSSLQACTTSKPYHSVTKLLFSLVIVDSLKIWIKIKGGAKSKSFPCQPLCWCLRETAHHRGSTALPDLQTKTAPTWEAAIILGEMSPTTFWPDTPTNFSRLSFHPPDLLIPRHTDDAAAEDTSSVDSAFTCDQFSFLALSYFKQV